MGYGQWGPVLSVYDAAHKKRGTRVAHLIAFTMMAVSPLLLVIRLKWGLAAFASGWAIQSLSHTFIERNQPCLRSWKRVLLAATWTLNEWRRILLRMPGRGRNGRSDN